MMEIGNWISRVRLNADLVLVRRSKWHLVESIVAGDAITKCGRRMEPKTRSGGYGLDISEVEPLTRMIGQPQLCENCS
jgi:hypothetical protein